MSSTDVFNSLGDLCYWAFENNLEPLSDGDLIWKLVLALGFFSFGYWMLKQYKYNKAADANPDQLK